MEEEHAVSATVEVPSKGTGHEASSSGDVMKVDVWLVALTWITFLAMTAVLYKVAWKPILKALDLRENSIRKALEEAEKARAETAAAEEKRLAMIREADAQAQKMLAAARAAADETARALEARAREEARNLVNDAKREIGAAAEKARIELRKETAELAIALAVKCISKSMDSSANRQLIQGLMREL